MNGCLTFDATEIQKLLTEQPGIMYAVNCELSPCLRFADLHYCLLFCGGNRSKLVIYYNNLFEPTNGIDNKLVDVGRNADTITVKVLSLLHVSF